jgi:hypothetical protein
VKKEEGPIEQQLVVDRTFLATDMRGHIGLWVLEKGRRRGKERGDFHPMAG